MTRSFQALAADFSVSYRAEVVTNGLALTGDVTAELVHDSGVRHIEVTLDGTAETHDRRRFLKNGRPSFARIYENIKQACTLDLPLDVSVRCNTDESNRTAALDLIDPMAHDGLSSRVRFYVAPLHSWGNDAHKRAMASASFAEFELTVLDRLSHHGFGVSYLPAKRPIVCMAVQRDAALFDAEGDQYNCTEVSYVPKYGAPNLYRIGLECNSQAKLFERLTIASLQGPISAHHARCRLRGCPKQWEEGLTPCPPTKLNIGERLLRAHPELTSDQPWNLLA